MLPRERQERLQLDVLDVARAMHAALDVPSGVLLAAGVPAGPLRINYECLGNVVAHVHWHLIPRRAGDADPGATVWVRPASETDCGCGDGLRDTLVAGLRGAMGAPAALRGG